MRTAPFAERAAFVFTLAINSKHRSGVKRRSEVGARRMTHVMRDPAAVRQPGAEFCGELFGDALWGHHVPDYPQAGQRQFGRLQQGHPRRMEKIHV